MIIGFTGKLGSGKDAAGERLAHIVGLDTQRISFAASLKESSAALLDIDPRDWEAYKNDPEVKIMLSVGYVDEEYAAPNGDIHELLAPNVIREFTAREFLQRYGTEAHRDIFGGDFWVEQALASYRVTNDELVYVTDCRFQNEAAAVRGLGGILVRVLGVDEAEVTHRSEIGLPDELITFEIDNSIRDDNFANLDAQLTSIAFALGIPLKSEALA